MDANIVVTQFTSSAIVVFAMQRLKDASWFPFLQKGRAILSRSVSVVAAFFIHTGISYVWDPTIDASGNRHLMIAIPTVAGMAVFFWHWLGQYAIQETLYQGTINRQVPTVAPTSPADK